MIEKHSSVTTSRASSVSATSASEYLYSQGTRSEPSPAGDSGNRDGSEEAAPHGKPVTDLRDHVFNGIDRLPTVAVLDRLHSLDEAPWADMSGKPLDARGLARMLREYMTTDNTPVAARNTKAGGSVMKGYYAGDLHDAWERYCPSPPESPLLPLSPLPRRSEA